MDAFCLTETVSDYSRIHSLNILDQVSFDAILAEGAIALTVTPSGVALIAS